MPEEMVMVVSNMPNADVAKTIARELVDRHLAACVNILPGVHSIYHWNAAVEEASEVTVLIKTRRIRYAAVEAAIQSLHPYDVPEIIAVPINGALPAYLNWMLACTELQV